VRVLPDILAPDLEVWFCGLAVGECAALRGHHHAGPGDAFWQLLHDAGFTPRRLRADEDDTLPSYRLGLTDVPPAPSTAGRAGAGGYAGRAAPGYDVPGLVAKAGRLRPRWVALTGKGAAATVARCLGERSPALGPVPWTIGPARVFVLPSPSGANRRRSYDGRLTRLDWWAELAALVRVPAPARGRVADVGLSAFARHQPSAERGE
jgi:double-stranded uracil-DNA glycosylase